MFCQMLSIFCDNGIPKYCATSPDLVGCSGFTGGGGSGGGGGAGREWGTGKCFDSKFKEVDCAFPKQPSKDVFKCYKDRFDTNPDNDGYGDCSSYTTCHDSDGRPFSCDLIQPWYDYSLGPKLPNGKIINSGHIQNGKCVDWNSNLGLGDSGYYSSPCYTNFKLSSLQSSVVYEIDEGYRVRDPLTRLPLNNDEFEDGYPIAVPGNPTLPENGDCDPCNAINKVINKLDALDNKLSSNIRTMDLKITEIDLFLKSMDLKIDLTPVITKLDVIISKMVTNVKLDELISKIPSESKIDAIIAKMIDGSKLDKIIDEIKALELIVDLDQMVDKTGTNFWDFLGGFFDKIIDLIEGLLDKIIYLVVPEDTSFIAEGFGLLNDSIKDKLSTLEIVKDTMIGAFEVEHSQLPDWSLDLPVYGRVTVIDTYYLDKYLPVFKQFVSAVIYMITAIWAYKKITNELIV